MTPAPVEAPPTVGRTGRAMGSATEIVVVGAPEAALDALVDLVDRAEQHIARLESCWSRFLPTSDVSALNRAAGRALSVDPSTAALVVHMVQAHRVTGGAFDPSLLPVLVALGYSASRDDPSRVTDLPDDATAARLSGHLEGVLVDPAAAVVQLPAGLTLDPGGIGKGLAADLVVADLLAHGAAGAFVGIGGDVRVAGDAPQSGGWAIGLDDPLGRPSQVQIRLGDGGVASSGTDRRRWTDGDGRAVHHLLDPATASPVGDGSLHDRVGATVVAGSAAWAEAWTKALMVTGDEALDDLEHHGAAGCIVHADGSTSVSSGWARFAVARPHGGAQEETR